MRELTVALGHVPENNACNKKITNTQKQKITTTKLPILDSTYSFNY